MRGRSPSVSGKSEMSGSERIEAIHFDTRSVEKRNPEIEHERAVAVYDLLEQNSFAPVGHAAGPYDLHLGVVDNRLMLDIRAHDGKPVIIFGLSLSPFRRVIREHWERWRWRAAGFRGGEPRPCL